MIDIKKIFYDLTPKQLKTIFILFFLLIIISFLSQLIGSFKIDLFDLLSGKINDLSKTVFFEIRAPRVVFSLVVGSSLSISGACLQALFRNPLADPGLIGVSSGAALGAAIAIVLGSDFEFLNFLNPIIIPLFSIVGSILVISSLYIITKGFKNHDISYLLLTGIAINALGGVGIGFLTYLSNESELRGLTFWSMGSFGGVTWNIILPSVIIILFNIIWMISLCKNLNILQLGEHEAYRLGVNVKKLKISVIISSGLSIGAAVSIAGIIGFVGLIVPHLCRMIAGVNNYFVLPSSILLGGSLMVFSDLISRTIIQPAELPIGLITSAIGSPFFLWLIIKSKNNVN